MSKLQIIEITVSPWDFDIEVLAIVDHGEPATWDHPGWPLDCSLGAARIGGVNVYDMLTDAQLTRLEEAVMRACDL